MKTTQTAGKQSSDKTGKVIDFRKDTPPTDWLMEHVKEKYGHLPMADIKVSSDYLREFIAELNELRCGPVCSNGQLAADTTADTAANASASANASTSANGQLAPSCICSLVEQLASPDVDVVVPKNTFLAIVCAAGYSQEDALEQYRNYYEAKLWYQNGPEIQRLSRERDNAHNWWAELHNDEARAQASAAGNELRALKHKIARDLEAAMSA